MPGAIRKLTEAPLSTCTGSWDDMNPAGVTAEGKRKLLGVRGQQGPLEERWEVY